MGKNEGGTQGAKLTARRSTLGAYQRFLQKSKEPKRGRSALCLPFWRALTQATH